MVRGLEKAGRGRWASLSGLVLTGLAVAVLAACEGDTTLTGATVDDPGSGEGTDVQTSTIARSWGGTIGDFVVDETRGVIYASVIDRNQIEVLDYVGAPGNALQDRILVGSQPSGVFLDRTGDTLIVANSGGTSLSFVDLPGVEESYRLETPNALLYSINELAEELVIVEEDPEDTVDVSALVEWREFTDRPLHVAQDRDGIIFYSTVSGGPIRMIEPYPTYGTHEANIMLWSDVLEQAPGTWAVTGVDSMVIEPESIYSGGTTLFIYDHVAGQPDRVIWEAGGPTDIGRMLLSLRSRGSDVFFEEDWDWNVDYWNLGSGEAGEGEGGEGGEGGASPAQQALFAASRDRSSILIGDGSRVWTWQAVGPHPGYANRIISYYLSIEDFVSNAGIDGLTGLDVDETGDEFVARGSGNVVYFNDVLRVHGSHTFPMLAGDAGVALHPTLPLAFAPTAESSILVMETGDHYQVVAELAIDEPWVGPVRLSMPRADDPATLLVRLHGLTADGAVVTVEVPASVAP